MACFLFRRELAGFFLEAGPVKEEAVHIMEITLLSGPFIGLFYLGTNYMQATGKALPATVLSLVRQGLLLIPMTIFLHTVFGKEGVFYAVAVTDFLSAGVSVLLILGTMASERLPGCMRRERKKIAGYK
ncbi:MAG: hypothetical protein IJ733_14760 [Lachnospiraceae bacterium]|nr:hypothetical protein [Lachnospiraceae bacterium]